MNDVLTAERAAVREGQAGSRDSGSMTVVPEQVDARPVRVRSLDPAAFPVPTGREEEWRFTPLDRLRGLLDGTPSEARLTWDTVLPDGVTLEPAAIGDAQLGNVPAAFDRLGALAYARAGGAMVLTVPRGAQVTEPVRIRLTGRSVDDVVWGHLVLDIGEQAAATVVLEHSGSATYASNVSVLVGQAASLDLVSVQEWDDDAVHTAHQAARLGRDARLRSTQVSLGGDLVRIIETVDFDGPGGDAELLGLFFADSGQHLEHRLFVDHSVPKCRSNVTYKGALQNPTGGPEAHAIWVGDVLIRAGAEGTTTYELNRNLLLTDGARADSVPNLEIETGEIVGAGHASATGRFDDEQLFYLQARGIPEQEARRLVVRGFFADVIGRIGIPEVQERLLEAIEAELAPTEAAERQPVGV